MAGTDHCQRQARTLGRRQLPRQRRRVVGRAQHRLPGQQQRRKGQHAGGGDAAQRMRRRGPGTQGQPWPCQQRHAGRGQQQRQFVGAQPETQACGPGRRRRRHAAGQQQHARAGHAQARGRAGRRQAARAPGGQRRQFGQQVLQLLAAGHRKAQQRRQHHRSGEAGRLRLPPIGIACAAPGGRPGPPRRQQHRQRRCVEPGWLGMGEAVTQAARRLVPEDGVAKARSPGQRRRHGPGEDGGRRGQYRQRAAHGPPPPAQPGSPPGRQLGGRQQVQQGHRPLGVQRPGQTQREPCKTGGHTLRRAQQAPPAQHDERAQQRIEHQRRAEPGHQRQCDQHQRRQRRLRPAGPQRAGQCRGRPQRAGPHQRRQQPRPAGADARCPPARLQQPEQQRRLVRIGLAIQHRQQPVAALPHLPGHGGVAGLVHRQQGPPPGDGGQQRQKDQRVAQARSRRISHRLRR